MIHLQSDRGNLMHQILAEYAYTINRQEKISYLERKLSEKYSFQALVLSSLFHDDMYNYKIKEVFYSEIKK